MNRDELLDKLAMELGEWPATADQANEIMPEGWYWRGDHVLCPTDHVDGFSFPRTEWLQRRTELINKPSWDDAPEWAEWLAQDKRGEWCFYPALPERSDDMWVNDEHKTGIWVDAHCSGCTPAGHGWRQTLESRPAFNESRADIIGQNGNDGDHYGARELNPTTSSLTNSQAREIAAEDGICSDGQPCGHPLTGDDAYCPGCPNVPVGETSTYCDRCGGEYWTPPHDHCPCLDGVSTDPHEALTFGPLTDGAKPTNPKDAIGSGKLPMHLWPNTASAMGSIGLLSGMLKYGRSNWRSSGVRASIYYDACRRHMDAWFEGEECDADDGVPHLAAALACLAIIVDAEAAGKLTDDRQIPGGYRVLAERLTPHVGRLKELHAERSPRHYTIVDADE